MCVYIYIFNYASTLSFTQAQGKKSTQTNNINNKTKTDRQHTYLIKQQKKNATGTKCADDNLSSLNRNIDKKLWKIIQTMR